MAGGVGSRLWPISRKSCPKQFVKIFNNKSLLQLTLERNAVFGRLLVIITKEYHELAVAQVKEVGIEVDFLIEPTGKNTAPCAISAALMVDKDEVLLLLPADHYIENTALYVQDIYSAVEVASKDAIVTVGITPAHIHTGYGYLKASPCSTENLFKVSAFVEKPSIQDAYQYIKSKEYYWNSGIFIFKQEVLLDVVSSIAPQMYAEVSLSLTKGIREGGSLFLSEVYNDITPNSIDFAFMEKVQNLSMIKAKFDWHDMGGWKALWDIHDKDSVGNIISGDVELHGTSNSYIHSDGRLTAVIGLDDIIVINTPDASLIVHKSRAEDVKHLVQSLVVKDRAEV